jgi:superfamily II DNA or RNA helicase
MKTYIYVADSKSFVDEGNKHVKIGSSNNPVNRRDALQTSLPRELILIRIFEIINYTAYAIDDFLKTINSFSQICNGISIKNYRPDPNGGKEHYIVPNIDDLEKLFDVLGVEYKLISDLSIFAKKKKHIERDTEDVNIQVVKELTNILKKKCKIKKLVNDDTIKLYDYQQECVDIFNNKLSENDYFQGIYYLATGLGKTFIEIQICVEHLRQFPEDNILWVTFRNDIIDGQKDKFALFGDMFIICNRGKLKDVNLADAKGKVIVLLRQNLIGLDIPKNTFTGVIYDECHDASKLSMKDEDKVYEGLTYEILEKLRKTQKLRYRIGFSATPLTDDQRQNQGIINLYGEDDAVNYLYNYSLVKGVEKKLLLNPIIEYRVIDEGFKCLSSLYEVFMRDDYEKKLIKYEPIITRIIDEINKIINIMIIKKGIIWFPNVSIVKYMYKKLVIPNINIYYSCADFNMYDEIFKNANGNCLMLACEKFNVGFDGKRMEFGINFHLNDSGHVLIQKLGRFTRTKDKEPQKNAYLYQFCEDDDNVTDKIVTSLALTQMSLGDLDEICEKITIKESSLSQCTQSSNIITLSISCKECNIEEINAKVQIELNGGLSKNSIQKLIRMRNTNVINTSDKTLREQIETHELIYTKKTLCEYLCKNKINIDLANISNMFKVCFTKTICQDIQQLYFSKEKCVKFCNDNKICDTDKYKRMRRTMMKLPPIKLINSGLYSGVTKIHIHNLLASDDSIYEDV